MAEIFKKDFTERGDSGVSRMMGYIQEAYTKDLYWPAAGKEYERMRRSDPEISIIRSIFSSLASAVNLEWQINGVETPNAQEQAALEFAKSVTDEIPGGLHDWLDTCVSKVPFFGWGWWEVVPGIRRAGWKSPTGWMSEQNDGRVGVAKMAWRDPTTIYEWLFDESGEMTGWKQSIVNGTHYGETIDLHKYRGIHLTFGDSVNPEGLTPLEAVYRLEYIKRGLEMVQGIGYEHAAGYLDVRVTEKLGEAADEAAIKRAARNVMTAQEGNYAVWPSQVESAELKDVPFSAAGAILEAIQYYGVLKMTIYLSQWAALSATTGAGSYAAMSDSSAMFLTYFNSMIEGFTRQLDDQLGKMLFNGYNAGAFAGMRSRPHLVAAQVKKDIPLAEIGTFVQALRAAGIPLGEKDAVKIRENSGGLLSEQLPADGELITEAQPAQMADSHEHHHELARRPLLVSEDEQPDDVSGEEVVTEKDLNRAMREFKKFAADFDQELYNLLNATVEDGE